MIGSFSLSSRQGSLKTLGDRSLDKFGGAAAAYSVRQLKTPRKEQRLLDANTGASVAYSLRKLRGGYTAADIRVRRSSDNTEKDIGFTNKGELDLDALIDHCTIYDGYVVTWYDQSGNGNNATQSTAAYQPKIVASGVTVTENDKPGVFFDGVNDYLTFTKVDVTDNFLGFNVSSRSAAAKVMPAFAGGFSYPHYAPLLYTDNYIYTSHATQYVKSSSTDTEYGVQNLFVGQNVSGTLTQYKNTAAIASASPTNFNRSAGIDELGRYTNVYSNGYGQEFIYYNTDKSSERSDIETNINNYYVIYSGGTDSGFSMRVRRSSDNAEKNIGFDDNGDLDIKELEDHCNSTDGFVTTWFDQSGNNKSFLQSTATKQPKIVSNGSTIKVNHKPALNFDNTDDYLWNTSISFGSSQTLFGVQNIVSGSSLYDKLVYISGYDTGQSLGVRNDFLMVGDNGSGSNSYYQSGSPVYYKNGSSVGGTRDNIYDNFRTSEQTLLTITGLNLSTWDELWLNNYDTTWMWSGYTQELVIYGADVSSRRLAIEREMNRYFKTEWREWTENDKSLVFDGVNDYVDLGTTAYINTGAAFSVSAWVKIASPSSLYPIIISLKTNQTENWRMAYATHTDYDDFTFGSNSTFSRLATGDIGIVADVWYHVVVTYNGSGVGTAGNYNLYVDGVTKTLSASGGYGSDTGNNKIGSLSSGGAYWEGNIDEVAIWNSELTSGQTQTIYNKGMSGDLTSLKPLGWWRLGDNDTYPTIKDNGSGGNDGTMTSMAAEDITPYKPAYNNFTTEFDGSLDYVAIGNVLDQSNSDAFSISAWIKLSTTSGWPAIVSKMYNGSPSYAGWNLSVKSSNQLYFGIRGSTEMYAQSSAQLTDGVWYHLIGTYDGGGVNAGINLYIDGSYDTGTQTGTLSGTLSNSALFNIGSRNNNDMRFPGNISDVSFYERVLTYSDIQKIWNGGQPGNLSSLEPVGWWRLGAGDVYPTITDYGSGGNNGTMTNMAAADIELDPVKYSKWSLDFDGALDRVDISDFATSLRSSNTFSVSLWVKAGYENLNPAFAISTGSDAAKAFILYPYDTNDGTHDTRIWYNGASIIKTGDNSLTGWNHFCYVQNGATSHTMYINGASADTDTTSKTLDSALDTCDIGGTAEFTQWFEGNISDVAIWSKALPLSDIQRIYNDGVPQNLSSLNPKGWWRMGDGDTYPTIKDHGSGSNNGTMTNMASGDIESDAP